MAAKNQNFGRFRILMANIPGTQQNIVKRKTGIAKWDHFRTCILNLVNFGLQRRKIKPGFRLILRSAITLRIATHFSFYRAMHFSAFARSWDRMSSVCPSVRLSVTLVICDHIGWKTWKLIAQTISPAPSLFVAKRRSTYSQENMGKFWGD